MSSSFEALPAGDSAEEDPDHSLENARESLLNTVSDLALSTGVYQNAYTSQVLLSISQLLRILATNPASETPDLELGELPPPEGISSILFRHSFRYFAACKVCSQGRVCTGPTVRGR